MSSTPEYDLSNLSLDDYTNQSTSTSRPLSSEDFEVLEHIGSGGFGSVHKAMYKFDQSFWAIKKVARFSGESSNASQIMNEIDLIEEVDHPNIIKLRGFYLTDDQFHLVLELAPNGDLGHRLLNGRFSERRAKHYILQVAKAIEHLHENQIVHRDVKTLNVLLMDDDQIKLTDFGLATMVDSSGFTQGYVGTPYSRAPEIILRKPYSKNVDWWSLGVLLYELVTGEQPFDGALGPKFLQHNILYSEVIYPQGLSRDCCEVISLLLTKDPDQRLNSLHQLKSTNFFSN